jgi:serine/threonine protein kinase
MRNGCRLLRLNPTAEFEQEDATGQTVVKVSRGAALTRYKVNAAIREFLESFRVPATLEQVAASMAKDGYDPAAVMAFGKQIVKTPMIEFHDPSGDPRQRIDEVIGSLGYTFEFAYKEKEFEGVYRVLGRDGRTEILKTMHTRPDARSAASIAARIENEYTVLRSLRGVHGVVDATGHAAAPWPHLTMRFVEGKALLDHGPRSMGASLALCARAARIVAALHDRGIVHGDLHTSNFLEDTEGDITLIDFDCAFAVESGYVPRIGGAIHFLPPERVVSSWNEHSAIAADYASDIYQAGVVMYALLTNDLPFRGATLSELSRNIRHAPYRPLPLRSATGTIPPGVAAFVHRCLSADRGARPRSLREFPHDAN